MTTPRSPARPGLAGRLIAATLAVAGLTVAAVLAAARLVGPAGAAAAVAVSPEPGHPAPRQSPELFRDWPPGERPALALMLSGQEYGYIQKCGCSNPQLGGLERRYNFVQALKARGWPVLAVDAGDVTKRRGLHEQALLKYTLSMRALERMNYVAVGVGREEMDTPLLEALAQYTLQYPDAYPRVLAANLLDRAKNYPLNESRSMVGTWELAGGKNGVPLVGVGATVGASVAAAAAARGQDPTLKFADNLRVLTRMAAEMDEKNVRLRVLVYQGTQAEAIKAAAAVPRFDLIQCLSPEDEPAAAPEMVGKTTVVSTGHKGKYVGVVGVFTRDPAAPPRLRYQLVPLGEEYDTPPAKEAGHPVLDMFQAYAQQLKDENFLAKYPKGAHPSQIAFPNSDPLKESRYVGSQQCLACHQEDAKVYEESKHAHAYEALEKIAKKPTLRNYDGECIVCHVVGFDYRTGYTDEFKTPLLKNVGCESCHGPGGLHTNDPKNEKYFGYLSPWKLKRSDRLPPPEMLTASLNGEKVEFTNDQRGLINRIDAVCQKCHDTDNDPKYRFELRWPAIAHGKSVLKAAAEGQPRTPGVPTSNRPQ